jgi:methyl-accepting chemotaxis protein/methyl-accepting chemotaxis protein-1 (serine sensor receptor)
MTIGRKFALTAAFLSLMTIVLGAASLAGLSSADRSLSAVADESLAGVSACSRVQADLLELRGNMWRHVASTDAADKARLDQEVQRLKEQIRSELADVQKAIHTDEEREMSARIQPLLDRYARAWDGIADLSRASKNDEAYKKYVAEAAPVFDAVKQAVAAETEYNRSTGARNGAEAHSQVAHTRALIWVVLSMSVGGGAGMLFLMVRSVNRALVRAVSEVGSGAAQVASAATQIASASQALAQGSSEQAASLEETSSSSEEINSMAHKNTDNTRAAAELVGRLQAAFSQANSSLDATVSAMQELTGSSEKISRIIKVIDEIAFQTNILALNAAVEAARAGEAGMGFAVVADEVRNLAQRSAQAAKDTASLIEDSIVRSRDGKAKVDHVAAAIRAIAEDSTKIQLLVDEVNVASQEQSRGIEQVAKAVTQMENVTQRAAASAEESASASAELTAQASALKDVVARLSEMVGVGTHAEASYTAVPAMKAPVLSAREGSRREFPLHEGEGNF